MSTLAVSSDDAFYPTIEALAAELDRAWHSGDAEGALLKVQAFVQACILDRRSVARVFADPMLDGFCQLVGRSFLAELGDGEVHSEDTDVADEARADCVVLATELYRTGGHTAVIVDLLETQRFGPRTVVMLTDAFNKADPAIIEERFGTSVTAEIAPAGGLADKLRWTLRRLLALRPRKLVLMNHHHDPVAIAAAQPSLADQTVFYHHGDHQLCLGVTLSHTLHIDPHPMGFHNCHDVVGIEHPVYWPLVAQDLGTRSTATAFLAEGRLRTCSSGSHNKFEGSYKYAYADVMPRVMERTGGTHVHIGPLSDATLQRIRDNLSACAIPQERFVHVPWVASIWKALHDHRIDVYLSSFPLGGAKTAIEAMGAGVPIIGHNSYISPFYGAGDMYYPSAFLWTDPDQLIEHLGGLTVAQLARESLEARQHFERFHTAEVLADAIDAGADAPPAPAKRQHAANPLQLFLDDVHYALDDHLTAAQVKRRERQVTVRAAEMAALNRARELEIVELARLASEAPQA